MCAMPARSATAVIAASGPIPALPARASGESARQINIWWERLTEHSVGLYLPG